MMIRFNYYYRALVIASLVSAAAGNPNGNFAENTCAVDDLRPGAELRDTLPGGQIRCCAGFYGPNGGTTPATPETADKWGSCDTSSCVENFRQKNRNCFNYGSPEHPIAIDPAELTDAAGKQQGGARVCPYLKSDQAICDVSSFVSSKGNCRNNPADNHCLGIVKCGSSGITQGSNTWNTNSDGTDWRNRGLSGPDVGDAGVPCFNTEWTGATCFYDGTSDNWKVCGAPELVEECDVPCDDSCIHTCDGGSFGDPHVLTWSGEHFEYMGQCDLVLVDAPAFTEGLGFTAHIRTKALRDFSYIEAASIKIGDDILEVGSYGEYFLNGVNGADMSAAMLSGFPVEYQEKNKKEHVFHVNLGHAGVVTLKSYTYLVSIKFEGVKEHGFEGSVGLMGDYYHGKHLARDGKTIISDINAYGQEWQVLPAEPQLFDNPAPEGKCSLPDALVLAAQKQKRRLGEGISVRDAEAACAQFQYGLGFEECVEDVIATGDLDAANAGAF